MFLEILQLYTTNTIIFSKTITFNKSTTLHVIYRDKSFQLSRVLPDKYFINSLLSTVHEEVQDST